jgi:UDP-N-acetylglucosamine 2-epimerase (non-hydrolysing)
MNILVVLGARPQIVKSAPFIHLANKDEQVHLDIIHTGQHYDYEMTKIFFEELRLPDPLLNLNVGSGTHAQQTAKIMLRLEKILQKQKPDLVIVPGDTNSTVAGALTAAKLNIPIAHIEAGARSYDMSMPEEINRRLTDHCSTLLFTPTENCTENLLKEGIEKSKIFQCGDTMYDVLIQQLPKTVKSNILKQLNIEPENYALLTMHRPENVDNPENLKNIITALIKLKTIKIIFPVHPRTQKKLQKTGLNKILQQQKHIILIKPVSYHDSIKLIKNARLVFTDSGGIQKEAFWLHTPCITLRKTTEWLETIKLKTNFLVATDSRKIVQTARKLLKNNSLKSMFEKLPNPFGDGDASRKILDAIKNFLS